MKIKRASINKPLAAITVRLDQRSVVYGRKADTLFSGLESIGGFFESLMHMSTWFVLIFSERLFVSSFIRQLY
jgi:hypothetical protein